MLRCFLVLMLCLVSVNCFAVEAADFQAVPEIGEVSFTSFGAVPTVENEAVESAFSGTPRESTFQVRKTAISTCP